MWQMGVCGAQLCAEKSVFIKDSTFYFRWHFIEASYVDERCVKKCEEKKTIQLVKLPAKFNFSPV